MKKPNIIPTVGLIIALIANIGFYKSMFKHPLTTQFDTGLAIFLSIILSSALGACIYFFYKSVRKGGK